MEVILKPLNEYDGRNIKFRSRNIFVYYYEKKISSTTTNDLK